MPDVLIHISGLTPDPRNARRHTPRNVGTIADALREVGAARSIVIDEDNVILAGNATIEAAADAGITKLQVVEADGQTVVAVRRTGLTPNQKARLALYDNRSAELADGWDTDILKSLQADGVDLSNLWHDDELAELLRTEPQGGRTDPDDVPAERATNIKLGDLFELGAHRLLCGDCTVQGDVSRLMGDDRADCVFTSPPYGVGVAYGQYEDTLANLRVMLPKVSAQWRVVVVAGGFAVVNFGDIVGGRAPAGTAGPSEYPMALEYWPVFRADQWEL